MDIHGATHGDELGQAAEALSKTPTRQCAVLEEVRTFNGEVVTWTMGADRARASLIIVAVRASHPEAKIVIGGTRISLEDLPEHGTVRLPRPMFVRVGTPIELDPGVEGSIELLGAELPQRR